MMSDQNARPIAYDITHLVSRMHTVGTSGIDRVDLAYVRHFVSNDLIHCGVHFGLNKPHRFSPKRVAGLLSHVESWLGENDAGPASNWEPLRAWIIGSSTAEPAAARVQSGKWRRRLHQSALRVAMDGPLRLPAGAIYLSVAQHAFEFHRFFRWLDRRPDVMPVFLVHDLLPFKVPEFFKANYEARFERRFQTIIDRGRAIITTSHVVREQIEAEYAKRRRPLVPIHVQPLASPLGPLEDMDRDALLSREPYFVMVSTIEPRKNHLMILHVWQALAAKIPNPPKLVIVGATGWESDQTISMIARSLSLRGCVRRATGLPRHSLRSLIANARALLMPSFTEGYGLPIVEALTLGTPVIASDIPVFHEVSQGRAEFISPINGEAWLERIVAYSATPRPAKNSSSKISAAFVATTWQDYFGGIEAFIKNL